MALCTHLALALVVLQTVNRRKIIWLGLAIGWHTLVNAIAVYAVASWGAYLTEGILVLFTLASLGIIFKLRDSETTPAEIPSPAPPVIELSPMEISTEKLDDSRYD